MNYNLSRFCREYNLEAVFQNHYHEYVTSRSWASKDDDDMRNYDQLMDDCDYQDHLTHYEDRFLTTITCKIGNDICTIELDTSPRGYNNSTYKIKSIQKSQEDYDGNENNTVIKVALKWIIEIIMVDDKKRLVYGTLKYSMCDFIDILEEVGFYINYTKDLFEYNLPEHK